MRVGCFEFGQLEGGEVLTCVQYFEVSVQQKCTHPHYARSTYKKLLYVEFLIVEALFIVAYCIHKS